MNNNVEFVSRWTFKKWLKNDVIPSDTACISISDTLEEQMEIFNRVIANGKNNVMFCNFPDDETGMMDCDAKRIVNFINENKDKSFLIHCFAGISRSGAVAKFINAYLELDIPHINNYNQYNKSVYNKLNAQVGRDLASYYAELENEDRPSFSR